MQQYSQGFIQSSPTPLLACTCCPSLHLHVLCAGQGGIAAPGSIAATPVEAPVDVEEGLPVEVPLVYFYGHVSPADNPELYKFLVERLAALLDNARRGASSLISWGHALACTPPSECIEDCDT